MNTETTVLAAIVLAVLIIAAVFTAVEGSVMKGGKGVKNLSGNTNGKNGHYNFTSANKQEGTPTKINLEIEKRTKRKI